MLASDSCFGSFDRVSFLDGSSGEPQQTLRKVTVRLANPITRRQVFTKKIVAHGNGVPRRLRFGTEGTKARNPQPSARARLTPKPRVPKLHEAQRALVALLKASH